MATTIAVVAVRAGSGSTGFASSLAWTLAEKRQVMLLDVDMSGGTIADLFRPGKLYGRGLARLFHPEVTITAEQLHANAIEIQQRRNLRIVPGFHQFNGPLTSEILASLRDGLKHLSEDVAICDLGPCLSYPGLQNPRGEGEEIFLTFNRIFVVLRDDPVLLPRSIEILAAAKLPQAELVIVQSHSNAFAEQIQKTLQEKVGEYPIAGYLAWDDKRAQKISNTGIPLSLSGQLAKLHL